MNAQKTYRDMTDDEIKKAVRRIVNSSSTPDEIRRRICEEIGGYPYSPESIAITQHGSTVMLMMWGHTGSIQLF